MNRWTSLPAARVVTLAGMTGGHLEDSLLWRDLLRGNGVNDVALAVLRDGHGCWGFLDRWRSTHSWAVHAGEWELLASKLPALTRAVRAAAAAAFTVPNEQAVPDEPAVLLLTETLGPGARTPPTEARLRALLPTPLGQAAIPAAALNVAAQLLANETTTSAPSSPRQAPTAAVS